MKTKQQIIKIFALYLNQKGLVLRSYKEHLKSSKKMTNTIVEK